MVHARDTVVLLCIVLGAIGCNRSQKEPPASDQPKIGELAPSRSGGQSAAQLLHAMNFGLHIFEVPADNVGQLENFWNVLSTKPLRFNSPEAFKANSFLVGFGQIELWDRVHDLLYKAGGQTMTTVSLMLADDQAQDLPVTGLSQTQTVSFVSGDLTPQRASIGPGILALRIKATKIPDIRGTCTMVAHPVFTLPATSSIPELAARGKLREFPFVTAAFGLRMSAGDFVVLGPEKYLGDFSTLSSVFFSNPEGSVFFSPGESKPPQRKPSVRLFLLVCIRIDH